MLLTSAGHHRHKKLPFLEEDSAGDADVEERSMTPLVKRRKRLRSRGGGSGGSGNDAKRHYYHNHHPATSGEITSEQVQYRHHSHHHRVRKKKIRSSIVCRMLSSPGSLVRMCLKHSNYMKASEVLKILHMETHFGQVLIHFAEQYEAVSKELTQQSRRGTPTLGCSPASGGGGSSSSRPHSTHHSHSITPPISSQQPHPQQQQQQQQRSGGGAPTGTTSQSVTAATNISLQVAIMNAKSTFDPLQCVHKLLAPSTTYQILFAGDTELEKRAQRHEGLQRLMKHVPSLIMLDLVCSSRMSGEIATKLLEAALDRLQNHFSSQQFQDGPIMFLRLLSSIPFPQLHPSGLHHPHSLIPSSHLSPHALLSHCPHSLSPLAISQARAFADMYREAREKLEAEMDLSSTEMLSSGTSSGSSDVFSQLSQLVDSDKATTTITSPLRQQTPASGSIFDELIRALHSVPNTFAAERALSSLSVQSPAATAASTEDGGGVAMVGHTRLPYLWHFSRYLSKLIELLFKSLGMTSASESLLLLFLLH